MKGKGKKGRDSDDECSLLFVDFKSIDVKDCPRISSILERDESEGVGLEDLDTLQLELESLLVSVITRKNLLESEMELLVNLQDVKMKEKKSIFKATLINYQFFYSHFFFNFLIFSFLFLFFSIAGIRMISLESEVKS